MLLDVEHPFKGLFPQSLPYLASYPGCHNCRIYRDYRSFRPHFIQQFILQNVTYVTERSFNIVLSEYFGIHIF